MKTILLSQQRNLFLQPAFILKIKQPRRLQHHSPGANITRDVKNQTRLLNSTVRESSDYSDWQSMLFLKFIQIFSILCIKLPQIKRNLQTIESNFLGKLKNSVQPIPAKTIGRE